MTDAVLRAQELRQEFEGTFVPDSRPSLVALHDVHRVFAEWLYLPDPSVLDVTLATYVAHLLGFDLWMMLIGASSSGKTEFLRALHGRADVHPLSSLTAQTFASGLKGKARASLLHRMQEDGRSFLVLKDFTTVLTMHRDARQEILAQLREIFDGSYVKEFGTGESVEWEGRLGLLAGVTPAIDSHRVVASLLGERFLYVRLPQQDRAKLTRRALESQSREPAMRDALREAVHVFLDGVTLEPREVQGDTLDQIIALANVTTWARSGVERDGYGRDIISVPELEAPARFAKQLSALVSALSIIGHGEDSALALARRVAADSMPPTRREAVSLLLAAGELTTPEVADGLDLPKTTTERVLEDLTALKLVERQAGAGGPGRAHRWHVSEKAAELWKHTEVGVNDPRNVGTPEESGQ